MQKCKLHYLLSKVLLSQLGMQKYLCLSAFNKTKPSVDLLFLLIANGCSWLCIMHSSSPSLCNFIQRLIAVLTRTCKIHYDLFSSLSTYKMSLDRKIKPRTDSQNHSGLYYLFSAMHLWQDD